MGASIPVIDLEPLRHGGEAGLATVAAELGQACRGVGFFYVVNHGAPAELVAEAFDRSRAFFAEPIADKLEIAMDLVGGNRGYSGFMREALDPSHGRDKKEAFNIGLDLAPDKLDRPLATLRLLRYPPEPVGEIGAGEHTDYGNITLLATDGVGGPEVRTRGGEWLAAPSIAGAFVVNIGDCLMRWTNDRLCLDPAPRGEPGRGRALFDRLLPRS